MSKPFAIVTGASSGIGLELGAICAQEGFDLLVAADRPEIQTAADRFRSLGAEVTVVETDLATTDGVDQLWAAAAGRPVDALLANAGHGLGHGFLDQDFEDARHVIDTNVTGTIYLVQLVGRAMRSRGKGRILLTGSIAGFMPGTYQAVYNGTKAFVDSFSFALARRAEGHRRHGHMPHARRHRNRLLRAGRHAGHQSRPGQEGRSRRCGARRLRRHDARRRRRRQRLEEQTAVRDRQRHSCRHARGAASKDGRAWLRAEGQELRAAWCDGASGSSESPNPTRSCAEADRRSGIGNRAAADRRHQRPRIRRIRGVGRAGRANGAPAGGTEAPHQRRGDSRDLHQRQFRPMAFRLSQRRSPTVCHPRRRDVACPGV